MHTNVFGKKRLITVIISSLICLAIIIFIIWKMSSLTRNLLNNDDIRANVDCVSIASFSDASIEEVFKKSAPGIEVSSSLLSQIRENKEDICVVNLRYSFYNNTGKKISDFSIDISPIKGQGGKVYTYSPVNEESYKDNVYTLTQSIVVHRKDIDEKYFTTSLPLSFEANFAYEFSYNKEGQMGRKYLNFTTVKREEEVDEYEKLFENKTESDGETVQN